MNIYFIFSGISFAFVSVLLIPLCKAKGISIKQKRVFSFIITVVFIAGSLALYQHLGAPAILPLLAKREVRLAELKIDIEKNALAIKENPKDIKPWVDMGDDFMETGQYAAAKNAFKQAVLLSAGNPIIIMAYARAIIVGDDGKVSDEAEKSLKMVLTLTPENEEASYFMAVRKLQTGDTQNAMKEMKALYKSLYNDSPVKAMINKQIGRD